MSTINMEYNPNQQLTVEEIRKIAREEANANKTETWFNPVTGNIHQVQRGIVKLGDQFVPNDTMQDIWRNSPVVANSFKAKEGAKRLAAGHTNADIAEYMPFTSEYLEQAKKFKQLVKDRATGRIGLRESAGIIRNSDYQTIAETLFTNEIIDLTLIEYVLEGAVTQKTSDVLKVALPGTMTQSKPWSKGLRESDTPDPFNPAIAVGPELTLQKMATRYEISNWFDLTARRFNVEQLTQQAINADAPRIYDEEIRALLLTFTDITAGSWSAVTSGVSNRDPTTDFEAALSVIATNAGRADTVVMSTTAFNAMVGNTFMRSAGLVNTQTTEPSRSADFFGATRRHEKLPDLTIYTSRNTPVGSVYVYDKDTIQLYKGPSRVGNYEDVLGTHRGTLYERWYGSVILQAGWGRELTGVAT